MDKLFNKILLAIALAFVTGSGAALGLTSYPPGIFVIGFVVMISAFACLIMVMEVIRELDDLEKQVADAATCDDVRERVAMELFEQVEALWRIQPRQAVVRDVRQCLSEIAWVLGQCSSEEFMGTALAQVTPQALMWLVTHKEGDRHAQLLEHLVLYGTMPTTQDKDDSPEPEPPPAT